MKIKLTFLLTMLIQGWTYAGFRYQDCVEIKDDFFAEEGKRTVGRIVDKRTSSIGTEYRVGDILFGIWFSEKDLVKIDKSVCEEVEKETPKEGK